MIETRKSDTKNANADAPAKEYARFTLVIYWKLKCVRFKGGKTSQTYRDDLTALEYENPKLYNDKDHHRLHALSLKMQEHLPFAHRVLMFDNDRAGDKRIFDWTTTHPYPRRDMREDYYHSDSGRKKQTA